MRINHIGSIWYHSETSVVPYSLNQFLSWDFFDVSYSKRTLVNGLFRQSNMHSILDFCLRPARKETNAKFMFSKKATKIDKIFTY